MSLEETKKLQDKLGYADVSLGVPKTHITIKEPKPVRPIQALEQKKLKEKECVCQKKLETTEDIREMAHKLYEMADKMLQSLSLDEQNHSPQVKEQRYNRRMPYYCYYPRESPPLDYYYYPRRRKSLSQMDDALYQGQLKRKHSVQRLPDYDYYYDRYYYR